MSFAKPPPSALKNNSSRTGSRAAIATATATVTSSRRANTPTRISKESPIPKPKKANNTPTATATRTTSNKPMLAVATPMTKPGIGATPMTKSSIASTLRKGTAVPSTTVKRSVKPPSFASTAKWSSANTLTWAGPSEVEKKKMEAEELFGRYLMSDFARLSCAENCRKAKESISKETTILWTAVSSYQRDLTNQEILLEDLEFLSHYAAKKHEEKLSYQKLLQNLPETTEKLSRLAQALERSQNYLEVHGIRVQDGDLLNIKQLFDDKCERFQRISDVLSEDEALDMAETVRKLRTHLEETLECYKTCQSLVRQLQDDAIRESSLKLGLETRAITELNLEIPEAVPTPKLIDF